MSEAIGAYYEAIGGSRADVNAINIAETARQGPWSSSPLPLLCARIPNSDTFLSSIVMESLTLAWWIWMILGVALMIAELLSPAGFFLFFFGVGGILTGVLVVLGVSSFPLQGLIFIGISLFCILLLRKPLMTKLHFRNRTHAVDSLVGETAKALELIAPQSIGRVEMRGSTWSALNTGSELIAAHVRCRVEKVEGLTLHVKL